VKTKNNTLNNKSSLEARLSSRNCRSGQR